MRKVFLHIMVSLDGFILMVNPVLLGAGTSLFKGGYEESNLKLLEVNTFDSRARRLPTSPTKKNNYTSNIEGEKERLS